MNSDRIIQLVSRKIDGEATMEELRELEHCIISMPKEAYEIDIVISYLQSLKAMQENSLEENEAWKKHADQHGFFLDEQTELVLTQKEMIPKKAGKQKWFLAAATVFIIAIFVSWFVLNKPVQSPNDQVSKKTIKEYVHQATIKTKEILPDGSVVWLNENSSITCNKDFGKRKREIFLNGEAFFDIAHKSGMPLTVHAKTINIAVKGTAFNVKAYPEDDNVETALIRGAIELSTTNDPSRKVMLRPDEKMIIAVNEMKHAKNSSVLSKSLKENRNLYHIEKLMPESGSQMIPEISWMQDKMVFNNERLNDIAERMQRWYKVSIDIRKDELKDLRFTGSFDQESLNDALKAMQVTYPFRFEIIDGKASIF